MYLHINSYQARLHLGEAMATMTFKLCTSAHLLAQPPVDTHFCGKAQVCVRMYADIYHIFSHRPTQSFQWSCMQDLPWTDRSIISDLLNTFFGICFSNSAKKCAQ